MNGIIVADAEKMVGLVEGPFLCFRAMAGGGRELNHVVVEGLEGEMVLAPPGTEALRFIVEGSALRAVRGFLKVHPHDRVQVYIGPDSFGEPHVAFIASRPRGVDRLKIWGSGFSLTVEWGSEKWDQWVVHPQSREIIYTGTGEYRAPPRWLEEAL